MKIHIFYSHYNITGTDYKFRPHWFNYEKCFVNFLDTIKDKTNIELHVVMDGKIEDNWIKKYKDKYIAHEIEGGTGNAAAIKLLGIIASLLDKISDKDLIYILENDYLHVNGWDEKVIDLFSTYSNLDYVSLYDHGDKYWHPNYDNLVSKLFVAGTHHWRTMISTCGSFVTTKKILMEDYDDQTGVTIPPGDHHKWIFLNETKSRFLLTAVPGLSTHCMEGLLSPTIDWEKINNESIIK